MLIKAAAAAMVSVIGSVICMALGPPLAGSGNRTVTPLLQQRPNPL
jgi:hypothetical protein